MKYRITFRGNTKGAIGIFYPCVIVVEAPDREVARLRLYDTHNTDGTPIRIEECTELDAAPEGL